MLDKHVVSLRIQPTRDIATYGNAQPLHELFSVSTITARTTGIGATHGRSLTHDVNVSEEAQKPR